MRRAIAVARVKHLTGVFFGLRFELRLKLFRLIYCWTVISVRGFWDYCDIGVMKMMVWWRTLCLGNMGSSSSREDPREATWRMLRTADVQFS